MWRDLVATVLDSTSRPLAVFVLLTYVPIFVVFFMYRRDLLRLHAHCREAQATLAEIRALLKDLV